MVIERSCSWKKEQTKNASHLVNIWPTIHKSQTIFHVDQHHIVSREIDRRHRLRHFAYKKAFVANSTSYRIVSDCSFEARLCGGFALITISPFDHVCASKTQIRDQSISVGNKAKHHHSDKPQPFQCEFGFLVGFGNKRNVAVVKVFSIEFNDKLMWSPLSFAISHWPSSSTSWDSHCSWPWWCWRLPAWHDHQRISD